MKHPWTKEEVERMALVADWPSVYANMNMTGKDHCPGLKCEGCPLSLYSRGSGMSCTGLLQAYGGNVQDALRDVTLQLLKLEVGDGLKI